jgi:hypothetical protein
MATEMELSRQFSEVYVAVLVSGIKKGCVRAQPRKKVHRERG